MVGIIGFIIGTILGSFIKALADRSLKNQNFGGRSYCPNCKKNLQFYDLLPIFSYLLLKGRCRTCHKKIGIEYLLVEVVMGILVGYLFFQASENSLFDLIFKTFFISILVALFLTDLKKMLIPDRIILPSIVIAFIYLVLSTTQPLLGNILYGLIIGGFFYSLIIITKGKGMGGGDVKLGAFIGLVLGFPHSIVAIILGFFSGALFSIFLLLSGKKKIGQVIPFGPFLVLGSLITLFWGNQILGWYLNLGY